MIITSLENDKIKNTIKLQRKKYRDKTNLYIVETEHLVEEAFKYGVLQEIITLEDNNISYDVPITYVTKDIMKKLSTTNTPTNIIGICKKKDNKEIIGNRILLLDEIQDPGNLGTIIRSAVAFNINTIILSENTVDLYNPKVLRSTEGMYTHINIIKLDAKTAIESMKELGYTIYSTNVVNGKNIKKIKNIPNKNCLIVGNEGNGVKSDIQALCDDNFYIPMFNNVESLNVAIATSILLYELANGGDING